MDVSDNHFYDGLKDCNLVRELVKKERGLIRAGLGLGGTWLICLTLGPRFVSRTGRKQRGFRLPGLQWHNTSAVGREQTRCKFDQEWGMKVMGGPS